MNEKIFNPEISIILPCFNEEKSIGACILEIQSVISDQNLNAEIIIVNNNSTDNSVEIISEHTKRFPNIKLIHEPKQGYGSAYLAGLNIAEGKYFFMADSDGTYDFNDIPSFINKLKNGNDLVVGNRFSGKMDKKAMPWHHKYIGNPVLSFLVKIFFKVKISDIHCGQRAISREAFNKITLYTGGMEFASEMIIKSSKNNLKIVEIPIHYKKRIGESKLRSLKDGWRHLRFILLYSPLFLFLIPGLFLFVTGFILMFFFNFSKLNIFGINFIIHPIFTFSLMIILGYQLIFFSAFSKIYAITHFGDQNKFIQNLFKKINLEKISFFGLLLILSGIIIYLLILIKWFSLDYGEINEIKNSMLALTLIVLGFQTFFSAFMLSIVGIKEK